MWWTISFKLILTVWATKSGDSRSTGMEVQAETIEEIGRLLLLQCKYRSTDVKLEIVTQLFYIDERWNVANQRHSQLKVFQVIYLMLPTHCTFPVLIHGVSYLKNNSLCCNWLNLFMQLCHSLSLHQINVSDYYSIINNYHFLFQQNVFCIYFLFLMGMKILLIPTSAINN